MTDTESLSGWVSISARQPELSPSEYGWLESEKVLFYIRGGKQLVAFRKQIDDDCPVRWCSDCSEGWDITEEVTHWLPLPPAPDRS